MGGIATNKITAIGSGSAEAEAVEAALKPTASKTLVPDHSAAVGRAVGNDTSTLMTMIR